ncbi:MAG: endonuclease/exonuclease/phosphatase family protein [Candidatus Heimdallarchaeota archaeon]
MALGVYGVIAIEWFVLAYPTAFTRWSDSNYIIVTLLTLAMNVIFVLLVTFIPKILENIRVWIIVLLNVLLLGSIVIVSALPQPDYTVVQQTFTYITAVLSPIALLDFLLLSRELNKSQPTARQLGGTFGIASFLFMILSFIFISSFNYEWVPMTGFLKDRYYIVMLIMIAFVFIPIVFIKKFKNYNKTSFSEVQSKLPRKNQIIAVGVIVLFAAVTTIGFGINRINPDTPIAPTTLSIMTYNVHQGEDKQGQPNFVRLLNSIRKADPDILALQESETARVCFGSVDLIRYLAENLNMYYYYGPKTVTGVYGVATLSKYPIEFTETYFMPSGTHSHRVIIRTDIRVGSELIPFFNTHFGLENEERIPQAAFFYELTSGLSRTIAVGDFNTKDNEFEYTFLRLNFEDSWLTINPSGLNGTGFNGDTNRFPRRRIDFILYTSDLTITDVSVLTWADESDHWPVFGIFNL